MAFPTQYIIYNTSFAKCMYSLSQSFRSESNSEPLRWNIRWIFLRKLFSATTRPFFRKKLHPADSKPLLNYSKSQAADLFANYGPIGTFSK